MRSKLQFAIRSSTSILELTLTDSNYVARTGDTISEHKSAGHHTKAAEHHEHAAAHHAHVAHGHGLHAAHHAGEATKHHTEEHGGEIVES
jgi:hypothetical protein